MGSRRFCEDHCGGIRFAAAIITDLIGHDATDCELPYMQYIKPLVPHLRKLVAVMGAETNATFPGIVEAAAQQASDLRVLPIQYGYIGPVSDHAAFSKAGQPFLFLSCGQGTHYHKPTDDMSWINFEKLAYITRFVADLIERIDRTPPDADTSPCDPFAMEIRMTRKALGFLLPLALRALKRRMPKSRDELNEWAEALNSGKLPTRTH